MEATDLRTRLLGRLEARKNMSESKGSEENKIAYPGGGPAKPGGGAKGIPGGKPGGLKPGGGPAIPGGANGIGGRARDGGPTYLKNIN